MAEYIEREAAIMTAMNYDGDGNAQDASQDIAGALGDIPAADVRPVVKARWIHVPSDGKFRDTCVCSVCKKSPPIESWIVQGFNACPYCFADMREES